MAQLYDILTQEVICTIKLLLCLQGKEVNYRHWIVSGYVKREIPEEEDFVFGGICILREIGIDIHPVFQHFTREREREKEWKRA